MYVGLTAVLIVLVVAMKYINAKAEERYYKQLEEEKN